MNKDNTESETAESDVMTAPVDHFENDRNRNFKYRTEQFEDEMNAVKSSRILQLRVRLNDSDLMHHCTRVYIFGTNHPFISRGGSWKLSTSRPTVLRPMLEAEEYAKFATSINERLHWAVYSFLRLHH